MNSNFTHIARWVLASLLVVFAINKWVGFLEISPRSDQALQLVNHLIESGYIMPLIGVMELAVAAALLFRKWVPLALLVLLPISVNILLYHLFLDRSGLGFALVVTLLNAVLMYQYKSAYRPLFAYSY